MGEITGLGSPDWNIGRVSDVDEVQESQNPTMDDLLRMSEQGQYNRLDTILRELSNGTDNDKELVKTLMKTLYHNEIINITRTEKPSDEISVAEQERLDAVVDFMTNFLNDRGVNMDLLEITASKTVWFDNGLSPRKGNFGAKWVTNLTIHIKLKEDANSDAVANNRNLIDGLFLRHSINPYSSREHSYNFGIENGEYYMRKLMPIPMPEENSEEYMIFKETQNCVGELISRRNSTGVEREIENFIDRISDSHQSLPRNFERDSAWRTIQFKINDLVHKVRRNSGNRYAYTAEELAHEILRISNNIVAIKNGDYNWRP